MEVLYIDTRNVESLSLEAFSCFELNPFEPRFLDTHEIIAIKLSGNFAAYAKVFRANSNDHLEFLEVAPQFRGLKHDGEKLSVIMFAEAFKRCALFSAHLTLSPYTEKGKRSLMPIEDMVAARYPEVTLIHVPGGA